MGSNELSKKTYEMFCQLYDKGTRVEAIAVHGITEGSKGTVQNVRKNGDVEVKFDKYGEILVKYPDELIRVVTFGNGCVLKMKRQGIHAECRDDCSKCAWSPSVDDKRKKDIRDGKMVWKKGVRKLIVTR